MSYSRSFRTKRGWCVLLIVGIGTAASGLSSGGLEIDFDRGQSMVGGPIPSIVDNDGRTYAPTVDEGTRVAAAPKIISTDCHSPPRCLRISMAPTAKGAKKNKITYNFWSHHKDVPGGAAGRFQLDDGQVTVVSFAMKLDVLYETPIHNMLHFQVSQVVKNNKRRVSKNIIPGGPIISLSMVPKSKRKNKNKNFEEYVIAVRSPHAQNLVFFDMRDDTVLYRGIVRKGEWNNFSFNIEFETISDFVGGSIKFRFNNVNVMKYDGEFGFSPTKFDVEKSLGIDLGIYRTADSTGSQTVYFDDIKIIRR